MVELFYPNYHSEKNRRKLIELFCPNGNSEKKNRRKLIELFCPNCNLEKDRRKLIELKRPNCNLVILVALKALPIFVTLKNNFDTLFYFWNLNFFLTLFDIQASSVRDATDDCLAIFLRFVKNNFDKINSTKTYLTKGYSSKSCEQKSFCLHNGVENDSDKSHSSKEHWKKS